MEIVELKKKQKNTIPKEKYDDLVKTMKKQHEKMVKGMFEFIDAQGGWLEFTYRFFKDDPLMTIRLVHGEICDLPMGIVKHLNNTYKKVRQMPKEISEGGRMDLLNMQPVTKISRVRFTPMDVLTT